MKTYEVFTENYSKIYQADGIYEAMHKHYEKSNGVIIAVALADRPDLLNKIDAATRQEGGECYVPCTVLESTHLATENEKFNRDAEKIWLKKATLPQISEITIARKPIDYMLKHKGNIYSSDIESAYRAGMKDAIKLMKGGEG